MTRYNGRVLIELSEEEFQQLLLALGYATGASLKQGEGMRFLGIANAVNRDNPDWTPYEEEEHV